MCNRNGVVASLDLNSLRFIHFNSLGMTAPTPLLLVLGLCVSASACTAAVALDGLAADSPFMPKQEASAAPVATENATVEFRGMITMKDGVYFGLYDRNKNASAWVKQDDKGGDFVVRSYDASSDMVSVTYQGQSFTLPLSTSKIGTAVASAVQPANAQPMISGGGRVIAVPAGGQKAAIDPQRMESVAAEVRRRRALRQASGNGAQTTAPAQAGGNRQ